MKVILIIALLLLYVLLGYVTAFAVNFIDDNVFEQNDYIFAVVLLWPIALAIFILWVIAVIVPKWMIEKLKEGGEE